MPNLLLSTLRNNSIWAYFNQMNKTTFASNVFLFVYDFIFLLYRGWRKKRTTATTGYCICAGYGARVCHCSDDICSVPILLFALLLSKIIWFGILFIIFWTRINCFTSVRIVMLHVILTGFGVRISFYAVRIRHFTWWAGIKLYPTLCILSKGKKYDKSVWRINKTESYCNYSNDHKIFKWKPMCSYDQ